MLETITRSNAEIARHVEVPSSCPFVIVAVAPCRSGTTAQLRVFAEAGAQAHYQPFKAILREMEQGRDLDFRIPEGDDQTIFIKETVGPYNKPQSTLDPIAILLEAGFPIEKVRLIPMLRQPLATFSSWIKVNDAVRKYFNGAIPVEDLLENLITSYKTVDEIRQRAINAGIPTTTFVQEALRDNSPRQVVQSLLTASGLRFSPTSVKGWRNLVPMGEPGSNIVFHPIGTEPKKDEGSQVIHQILLHSDGLQYISKEDREIDVLTAEQAGQLANAGLYEHYEKFRKAAQADLGVGICQSTEYQGFMRRKSQALKGG
ncbi:MAG: hypothetical protein HY344_03275 [Candidatus Levybacteria bacterium]|nr:hypothetical protein [Candidatus Levybacteria bacterium]